MALTPPEIAKQKFENKQKRPFNHFSTNVHDFETYRPEWTTLDTYTAKKQPWFWKDIIPYETITLFGGEGGIGKSLLLLDIIAKTTTGAKFIACGQRYQFERGRVLLLSAEDDPECTIKPKIMAAGGDCSLIEIGCSKVASVSGKRRFFELDKDLDFLQSKLDDNKDIKLIVIDPIAYFIGQIRDNDNPEVATFLNTIIHLTKKYKIATIFNKHRRKKSPGAKAVITSAADEIGGAGAWTNTPRKCWLISNDAEDENIKTITDMKNNMTKKATEALAYTIEDAIVEEIDPVTHEKIKIPTSKIEWLKDKRVVNASQAANPEAYNMRKEDMALTYIYKFLEENGIARYAQLRDELKSKGISNATFRRSITKFKQVYKEHIIEKSGAGGCKTFELVDII